MGHRVRRRRAAAQLLLPGRRSPEAVVEHLLAVQAQDLRAAYLALRARGVERATDIDRALTVDRSLVVGWLGRGTLHLVRSADYRWLLRLTAPGGEVTSLRRLAEQGVPAETAERAVELVERELAQRGPLPRADLVEALRSAGIPAEGQVGPHVLRLAALRGTVVLGPVADGQQAYALAADWLGPQEPEPSLAVRYLRGHGPATETDLARWAGIPLRDARAALRAATDRVVEVDDGLLGLAERPPDEDPVPARLLPAFDPYLLGWQDRGFAVPLAHAKAVHPGGGILRAVATVDGRVVGTWSLRADRATVTYLDPPDAGTTEALTAEAEAVAEWVRPAGSRLPASG
ncbi:winged helix DNA-binding domain-containing protein [Pseudonocardia sp. TRM90224]|uniref:winged helix DNA-binding domain-containing protein n=1 Tax=Pseudonocardia sp. TRM90224 TaxID=2812678 RepID=UPI001E381E25|nr:winged helix DNA-binding domain-containing protein [Pseudonocardia sp. TRM90224]